jgi:hypothetical protein
MPIGLGEGQIAKFKEQHEVEAAQVFSNAPLFAGVCLALYDCLAFQLKSWKDCALIMEKILPFWAGHAEVRDFDMHAVGVSACKLRHFA